MARTQGKHRESGINWSVATLKKVLLHECKRHSARRVTIACSAVLSWGRGIPQSQLVAGTSVLSWLGGTPDMGYFPHWQGLEYLPPERKWDQRPGKEPGTSVPPPPHPDGQTPVKTVPSASSDAGGNDTGHTSVNVQPNTSVTANIFPPFF